MRARSPSPMRSSRLARNARACGFSGLSAISASAEATAPGKSPALASATVSRLCACIVGRPQRHGVAQRGDAARSVAATVAHQRESVVQIDGAWPLLEQVEQRGFRFGPASARAGLRRRVERFVLQGAGAAQRRGDLAGAADGEIAERQRASRAPAAPPHRPRGGFFEQGEAGLGLADRETSRARFRVPGPPHKRGSGGHILRNRRARRPAVGSGGRPPRRGRSGARGSGCSGASGPRPCGRQSRVSV